ncbi:expressed conserved protein [Echinococcus multilocularis]|uniref:Expressed conserved protein n=1 Tax=Echinococcus multilocularis TaxID=6211 RepID=A0A087VYV5_ECHMU|nr:expressed conserved protein [Echinococcus multilocularis]
MATAAAGTVKAIKRLFENGGNSESGSFINGHDNLHNGTSRGSNSHSNLAKSVNIQNGHASSVLSCSTSSERLYADRAPKEQSRNKLTPPKVKPKPHVYRKTAPTVQPESSDKSKILTNYEKIKSNSAVGPSMLGCKAANGTKENNVLPSRLPISSNEPGSKHSAVSGNDVGIKANKERNESDALSSVSFSSRNPSKKPPPIPKKPKSILSGYSNDGLRTHYKYDEALEEQFGIKVDQSSYDLTGRWVAYQAERQQETVLNKLKKRGTETVGKTLLNGEPMNLSRTSSITSSTGRSCSNFTNSSIRSILKKGRPSLGVENKKRLTFKDDNELITKYNYPSEESYDDVDSLDRYRSALDSDSDSSSTFDEPEDYDFDNVNTVNNPRSSGDRINENRILFAGSTASSSTLKGLTAHQQKHSSHSSRNNYSSSKNNSDAGGASGNSNSGKKITVGNSSTKCSEAFTFNPLIVTPSKGGSKSHRIVCKTEKL